MNNNILIREAQRVVEPLIRVNRYNAVTPFCKKGQEETLPSPPDP